MWEPPCAATFFKMMDISKTNKNINVGMNVSRTLFYHDMGEILPEVMDAILYAKVREALVGGGVVWYRVEFFFARWSMQT